MSDTHADTSLRLIEDSMCPYRRTASGRLRIVWEITNRCNLSCRHCFVDINVPARLLTTEECLAVIDEIACLPVGKVMFTGGEPFSRRDFVQILAALRRACPDIVIDVTTNLSYVDDPVLSRLAALGLTELTTSLDGDREAHDFVRRKPGDFDRVLNRVHLARAHGLYVDAVMVVNRLNMHAIPAAAGAAHAAGISSMAFAGLIAQKGAGDNRLGDLALSEPERDAALLEIDRARERYRGVMPIRTTNFYPERHYGAACGADGLISINHEGFVYRCLLTSDAPASRWNVRTESLARIANQITTPVHKLEIGGHRTILLLS